MEANAQQASEKLYGVEQQLVWSSASAPQLLAGANHHELCCVASTEPAEGSKVQKVVFATVRPADYSLPYSTLEKNNVAFSAVDKRSNKLLTIMVSELPAEVVPVAAGRQCGHYCSLLQQPVELVAGVV